MGRSGWSSSDFLRIASGLVTVTPCTMACWVRTTSALTKQRLMGLYNDGSASDRNSIALLLDGGNVQATIASGSDAHSDASVGAYTTNVWFHAGAVFPNNTVHNSWLDGVEGSSSGLRAPTGINSVAIGAGNGTSDVNALAVGGMISDAALWDTDLSDAEMIALWKGFSPLKVRPANLIGYWPLIYGLSPEPDPRGVNPMSLVGTPTFSHSAHVYRKRKQ